MSFEKTFEHSDALFAAAVDEFSAVGYEQASINTILKTAGMSKGQFYYHFGSKEQLYLALIGVLIARKQEFLAARMRPEDFQQDIFGIFKTQLAHGLAFARAYPEIQRFSDSFIREVGNPIYKKALAAYNFEDNDAIGALVERAYANGEFRESFPLPFVKRTIGYLFTNVVEIIGLDDPDEHAVKLELFVSFLKSGLARE